MHIPPHYAINSAIGSHLSRIDKLIEGLPVSTPLTEEILKKIQHVSLLKSSLFSARIEGDTTRFEDLDTDLNPNNTKDITNLIKAISYSRETVHLNYHIDDDLIFKLHSYVLTGQGDSTKSYRNQMGAIFNASGQAIYVSPAPSQIKQLMSQLFSYIQSSTDHPFIVACIAHLIFEKIHPFIDGNGRVGRILIPAILQRVGYVKWIIPFEEYLDNHKQAYYQVIDGGYSHAGEYLEFMLRGYEEQIIRLRELIQIEETKFKKLHMVLPPRQEELFLLIKDHRRVTFDFIRRRFLKVPGRTLRYDLKKLCVKKLISTIGETRGRYYIYNQD